MKQLLIFLFMPLLWCACKNGNSGKMNSNSDSKLVLGAPAVVSTKSNNDREIKGPLAYVPNVPKLQGG